MAAGVMVLLLSLSALAFGVPQNASQYIPYVVKVISVYVCSGVIIHPHWILTAAQCFGSSKSAQIHWNNLVVDSTKVVIHPDYISVLEPGTVILGNNDLALIQVNIHTVHQVSNSNRQKPNIKRVAHDQCSQIKETINFSRCVSKIELDGSEWPQDYTKYNRPCMAFGTSRHRATSAKENYVHARLYKAEHGDQACECLPLEFIAGISGTEFLKRTCGCYEQQE
uniref:Peptidase S1 domain-containing protein n=1 Tax=Rhodnius prolixus TaxID=13249 RepID=T1H7Z4_RHOPR